MNRPDLHSAFTKINLWTQTQFRKIVYMDADMVAYRAPDELFSLDHAFSAAPDIGWPDLFNTGLMVLTPNMGDYYALMAMAQRGISFDGADQGLLNMYFKNSFNRLSFTYNVTPSAHYQYVPAYKHFQSSINMVHFIGPDKPWRLGRDKANGSSPFDQMVGRWWAVYDRHYRKETPRIGPSQPEQQVPEIVQFFVRGEYQPTVRYVVPVGEPPSNEAGTFYDQPYQPPAAFGVQYPQQQHSPHQSHLPPERQSHTEHRHHDHHPHESHQHAHHPHPPPPPHVARSTESFSHHVPSLGVPSVSSQLDEGTHTEARKDQRSDHQQWGPQPLAQSDLKPESRPQPEPAPSWDAQWHPPPPDSKPEALNFPQTYYAMSSDPAPFVPPERYPSPPKNMWYEVPKEPPAHLKGKPKPIFPWETHQPRPTRVFAHQEQVEPPVSAPAPASPEEHKAWPGSQLTAEPSMSGAPTAEPASEPQTPPRPDSRGAPPAPADIWSSFPRTNAWDNMPEINRYVEKVQNQHRRAQSRNLALGGARGPYGEVEFGWARRGSKVTDFPSEDDRPSLPVTPAPIRRPRRGGGGGPGTGGGTGGEDEQLQAAEGVPAQSDWVCVHGVRWGPADCLCDLTNVIRRYDDKDPAARLKKLAREQSELLRQRLGGEQGPAPEGREISSRPLPLGSEDARSPTYVAPAPPAPLVSPKPVKPLSGTSPVSKILAAAPGISPSPPVGPAASTEAQGATDVIQTPSYQGPGLAFEKGEDVPAYETPALPTEEERDVLET
ncbi:glycosyltransferase family 8 protein [Thermothielavioides terrestris NRRL 8126]|uniref:glycogenin glucosyltransferase n=1 Tax=Thermothielavioides terrestris (strain ATCC 38088 / NRRL 8126) TaxID=578455 RepID=G2QU97_THETT|nr:glycosyltransferase family 8 protein [Thermothielavioides terrestris NRRL 8126]AEO62849.1 glycosyltransferase family 8 protein [Thermothielavioides terrestris NRRL 8126]